MRRTTGRTYKGGIALVVILIAGILYQCGKTIYTTVTDMDTAETCRPAQVTYTNHSTADMPVVPMAHHRLSIQPVYRSSGSALFSSPQPVSSPVGRIYATSNATVHTISSGGGGAMGYQSGNSGSRGIRYTTGAASIPVLAMSSTSTMRGAPQDETYTSTTAVMASRPRRIQSNGDGSYNGETKTEDGTTYYWNEANEEWTTTPPVGTTKTENGITYIWNGSSWEVVSGSDPNATPIGDAAFPLLLFACALIIFRATRGVKVRG